MYVGTCMVGTQGAGVCVYYRYSIYLANREEGFDTMYCNTGPSTSCWVNSDLTIKVRTHRMNFNSKSSFTNATAYVYMFLSVVSASVFGPHAFVDCDGLGKA